MITVNNGSIEFSGSLPLLLSEYTILSKRMKEALVKSMGAERGAEEFNRCIQIAEMSNEELDSEVEKSVKKILDMLFRNKPERKEGETDVNCEGR